MYDLGITRLKEKYVLGALVPKNAANWHGPWDCAEFVSWLVYQVSGRLYGCVKNEGNPASADAYTGYWRRDAMQLGRLISVAEAAATPGAAVLRYAANGVIGHIAVSDGEGGTVEAHSSKTGVTRSVIGGRRWDTGVLVPWIDYAPLQPVKVAKPAGKIYRFTQPLMKGPKVKAIQEALAKAGFDPGAADGKYGSHTFAAVRLFQAAKKLVADGEVGPATAAVLGVEL